jgi:ribonucleoside-diphosphate reductase alpha chain
MGDGHQEGDLEHWDGTLVSRTVSKGYVRSSDLSNLYVLRADELKKTGTPQTKGHDTQASAGLSTGTGGTTVHTHAHLTSLTLDTSVTSLGGGGDDRMSRIREARMKGYVGDSCSECGNFTLVRNGTCLKCETCGSTSGCS